MLMVAHVVNLKLFFFWRNSFYNSYGNTNQVMQNLIPKLRQTAIISNKPGFLSEKLKTLTSSKKYHRA